MRPGVRAICLAWCVAALASCGNDEVSLTVDLVTDLLPGADFVASRVTLMPSGTPSELHFAFRHDVRDTFRIARLSNLTPGTLEVRVELLDAIGAPVFSRRVLVEARSATGITVAATRSCLGVACEETSTACHGGRCVDASCVLEQASSCGEGCQSDDECAPIGRCTARCYMRECVTDVVAGCGEDQWCHPDQGCIARLAGYDVTLTVSVQGQGRVTSSLGECGESSTCQWVAPFGSAVTLSAEPRGDEFWGWSASLASECGGTSSTCELVADGDLTISAVFAPPAYDVETLELLDASGSEVAMTIGGLVFLGDDVIASDTSRDRLFRVTQAGRVTPFAGTGETGVNLDPTPAAEALFTEPRGLATDAAGNVYVAERGSNRVRRIDVAGEVIVLAGSGEGISRDGPALEAVLDNPRELIWDEDGRVLYILTSSGLRALTDGVVSTVPMVPSLPDQIARAPSGAFYWSAYDGIWRLDPGGAPELWVAGPCNRPVLPTSHLRTLWLPSGELVEIYRTWGICRVLPDGSSRHLLIQGAAIADGPDYQARTRSAEYTMVPGPGGLIAFVDLYPGQRLRLMRPR